MKVIVFDSNEGGHRPSWLYCMAQACLDSGHELCLAAPFGVDRVDFWMEKIHGAGFHRIPVNHRPGFLDISEAFRLADLHGCDMLVLPYFDSVLEQISQCADQVAGNSLILAGVVFRPVIPTRGLGDHLKYAALKLIRTRAGKQARLTLRSQIRLGKSMPVLKNMADNAGSIKLFSLDSGDAYGTLCQSVPFASIRRLNCDPWLSRSTSTKEAVRARIKLPRDKFIFLHCGNFSKEKGLSDALDGWSQMPAELKEKSLILRAGKVPDKKMAARLHENGLLYDTYIPQETLDELYVACDCVLIPYRNHARSSGVLIHAAASGRPVIAPDFAVVGAYVAEYKLGYTFEHLNVDSLSKAMAHALDGKYRQPVCAKAFVKHNTKEKFISEIRSFFFD